MLGQRFGMLVVVAPAESDQYGRKRWLCTCDCGASKVIAEWTLKRQTRACRACASRAALNQARKANPRMRNWREGAGARSSDGTSRIWRGMWDRCTVPTRDDYRRYGARGVRVDESWRDYEAFLRDMGPRPTKSHTIDRRDNARGYEPGNCRWVTWREQEQNRTNNARITHEGETFVLAEWARRFGMKTSTLAQRLKNGWEMGLALNAPVRPKMVKAADHR